MTELDLENRDPNELNGHLGVQFEDVLGEPEGAHSIDCVWKLSYTCYTCGLAIGYKLCTTLCGICMALGWGCAFAATAFQHIWCCTPCCKLYDLECNIVRKIQESILNAICGPCCATCGMFFSNIVVTQKTG